MPASLDRRFKRAQQRETAKLIKKMHRETMNKFKGMTDEQIKNELEKFKITDQNGSPIIFNDIPNIE